MCAVEWKKLGDVCSFQRGSVITEKDAIPGDVPVLSGGQKPAYYHNQFNRKGETIVVAGSGAYAGFVSFWDIPVFLSDSFSVNPNDILNIKYVFYFLKNIQDKIFATKKGSGVPHVHGSSIAKFDIPIPSLAKQQEIVSHLDTFTTLISNLESELDMRRKQYEHYRNQLLDFDGVEGVEWKTLGDVCINISSGKNSCKSSEGLYPVFGSTGIIAYTDTYVYDKPLILVARVGANAGHVHLSFGKYDVTDNTLIVNLKDNVNQKYIYYNLIIENLNKYAKGGGQPLITGSVLKALKMPIPILDKQTEIVSKLDAFENLIQSLEQEIKLRKQQYEYYREKLLTFECHG